MSCKSSRRSNHGPHMSTTGNAAFDAYKSETLQRLRDARDKSEFDQFMDDREKPAAAEQPEA